MTWILFCVDRSGAIQWCTRSVDVDSWKRSCVSISMTHRRLSKIATILQTFKRYFQTFSLKKSFVFWFKLHRKLFLKFNGNFCQLQNIWNQITTRKISCLFYIVWIKIDLITPPSWIQIPLFFTQFEMLLTKAQLCGMRLYVVTSSWCQQRILGIFNRCLSLISCDFNGLFSIIKPSTWSVI